MFDALSHKFKIPKNKKTMKFAEIIKKQGMLRKSDDCCITFYAATYPSMFFDSSICDNIFQTETFVPKNVVTLLGYNFLFG